MLLFISVIKLRSYPAFKKRINCLICGLFYPKCTKGYPVKPKLSNLKASFESIKASRHHSFIARRFEETVFSAPYHFHPEYELTLIVRGSGKRYVGSHMNDYTSGDLVLLGSNLPHCWKTTLDAKQKKSVSVVIQFQQSFLGDGFFSVPETKNILRLLNISRQGIQFTGNTAPIRERMQYILEEPDSFKQLLSVLSVLHELSAYKSYQTLDKQNDYPLLPLNEQERIHAAMGYIVENFRDTISLSAVAARVSMTPEAFCKYFKKITRKTFIEVVNDYRVDFAIGQLVNTEKPVVEVGFNSGFNDISNFYKTFKDRTRYSPLGYRKAFVNQVK